MNLVRQPRGRYHCPESCAGGGQLMSTYEEFMIIISVAMLIVAIVNSKNK